MKHQFAFLFLLLPCMASAQDVIVKKDKSTIYCRIEEVADSTISYVVQGDESGTCYLIDKALVSSIIYKDGKRETFSKPLDPSNLNISLDPSNPYKKVRTLKTIGWVGGGVLAGLGTVIIAVPASTGSGFGAAYGIVYGMPCVLLGVGFTTTFLLIANKQKKKIDAALQTSAVYRYDIPLRSGSSLSVGADLMTDRVMNKQTVGLGLSYSF